MWQGPANGRPQHRQSTIRLAVESFEAQRLSRTSAPVQKKRSAAVRGGHPSAAAVASSPPPQPEPRPPPQQIPGSAAADVAKPSSQRLRAIPAQSKRALDKPQSLPPTTGRAQAVKWDQDRRAALAARKAVLAREAEKDRAAKLRADGFLSTSSIGFPRCRDPMRFSSCTVTLHQTKFSRAVH